MNPRTIAAPLLLLLAAGAVSVNAIPPQFREDRRKKDELPQGGSASYRPAAGEGRTKDKYKPDEGKRPQFPRPEVRPVPVPEPVPETRPWPKPGSGNGFPSQGGNGGQPGWPTSKPGRPDRDRPSTKPNLPEPERPSTKPNYPRPGRPDYDDDFLDIRPTRPDYRPDKPDYKPGKPDYKPGKPDYRPDRPSYRPLPVQPGINLPRPVYPTHRPSRPARPVQVNNVWQNHTQVWNQWTVQNNITINNFVINRPTYWGKVHNYWSSGNSWKRWNQPDWWEWRRDLWEYRRNRCQEMWNAYYWVSDQLFDAHWWRYCPWAANYGRLDDVPSWWWWTPASWDQLTAHVKRLPREQEPLTFDPGVSVILQDGRVYRNGRDEGSAWKFVESARREANPDFRWEPPFPGGRHEWLPLGVWALTQEELGEASMFLQLAISQDGLISGAFTNVQTGEDSPIKGGTNRGEQRVAFHIGNQTETVIECGLAHLTQDAAGAFIHFPNGNSQTWLLVRLPGPGVAPGAVRIPYLERRR